MERVYVGICFVVLSGDELGHHPYAIVLLELSGMDYSVDAV